VLLKVAPKKYQAEDWYFHFKYCAVISQEYTLGNNDA